MKNYLVIAFFFLLLFSASGQTILQRDDRDSVGLPAVNGMAGIRRIVKADSLTAKQLYHRAKLFFSETFKSAKAVIDLDDPESFTIVGKGILIAKVMTPIGIASDMHIGVTMRIECKDGRFRYSISNIMVKPQKSGWGDWEVEALWKSPKMSKKQLTGCGKAIYDIAQDIEKRLTTAGNALEKW